jgi:hypothetical protein
MIGRFSQESPRPQHLGVAVLCSIIRIIHYKSYC